MSKSVFFASLFLYTFSYGVEYSLAVDYQPCLAKMSNGCSVPLKSFPYKEFFRPACDRHDVCYQCGTILNWTRLQCDKSFEANMITLCRLKDQSKLYGSSYTIWDRLKSIFQVAASLAKWLTITTGTLDHCIQGSDTYYKSVRGFGDINFYPEDAKFCEMPCAKVLGNPGNLI